MDKVVELFEKTFKVNEVGCPWGSCKEDFLLDKAIETIEKAELLAEDKENLINLFKEKKFHNVGKFSNGKHAGKWYIGIIKEYFNNKFDRWFYNHDLIYFIDSKNLHCICNEEWIARFNTEEELLEYIRERS